MNRTMVQTDIALPALGRAELATQLSDLRALLDRCYARLAAGDTTTAMRDLFQGLAACRAAAPAAWWQTVLIPVCRRHPIRALVHEDPVTLWSFQKPRGYAGDAVLLDYIYRGVAPPGTSAAGRAILAYTTGSPNGSSLRARRDRLSLHIDRAAQKGERPRILSIACGHLREAQLSAAVRSGQLGAFYALDADALSLEVVEKEQSRLGVTSVHASVKDLLRGKASFSDLNLVYAAGLFDYLSDEVAAALVAAMSRMLAPGGTLLIANFVPENDGVGYMEAFMDWHLIYRREGDLRRLVRPLHPSLARVDVYRDPYNNVVLLEATRRN